MHTLAHIHTATYLYIPLTISLHTPLFLSPATPTTPITYTHLDNSTPCTYTPYCSVKT